MMWRQLRLGRRCARAAMRMAARVRATTACTPRHATRLLAFVVLQRPDLHVSCLAACIARTAAYTLCCWCRPALALHQEAHAQS